MIGIDVCVQHAGGFDGLNRLPEPRDRFRLATFAEVWYTLNQGIADF